MSYFEVTGLVKVVSPSDIGTKTKISLTPAQCNVFSGEADGVIPTIIGKRNSSGVGLVIDEKVEFSKSAGLLITEGSSGFSAGVVYDVLLVKGVYSVIGTGS
jgi:hypothetical protein